MKATRVNHRIPVADRLFAKLAQQPDGCIEFTGACMPNGYGRIALGGQGGGVGLAHRVAWELANGPIPEDLHVCHRCDNPPCCNPAHLFLGTRSDNMRDSVSKRRDRHGRRTSCKNGHLYDEANTRWSPSGSRVCRACDRARNPARAAAKKAARARAKDLKADPTFKQ
jgi:hypothetical protein